MATNLLRLPVSIYQNQQPFWKPIGWLEYRGESREGVGYKQYFTLLLESPGLPVWVFRALRSDDPRLSFKYLSLCTDVVRSTDDSVRDPFKYLRVTVSKIEGLLAQEKLEYDREERRQWLRAVLIPVKTGLGDTLKVLSWDVTPEEVE